MQEPINYSNNLKLLREKMAERGIKALIIPNADPHNSEEPSAEYSEIRNLFSAYHEPAGTLLVTEKESFIYTDGRFWEAAKIALKGKETKVQELGKENVLPIEEYIKENSLFPVGIDYSLFPISYLEHLKGYSLADKIVDFKVTDYFKNTVKAESEKIFKLDDSLLSTTFDQRIERQRENLKLYDAESILFSSLDDIAYLLGYRGKDIPYCTVFYSYLYISLKEVVLFIDKNKIPEDFSLKDKVEIKDYSSIFSFLKKRNERIILDKKSANIKLFNSVKKPKLIDSPVILEKSIKGEVEIKNTIKYHLKDGYYVFKLMYYIEKNRRKNLDEYHYASYLDNLRLSDKNCFSLSFPTIAAVDKNAVMMHYGPSEKIHSPVSCKNKLLLVDSGGHYYGATTDITRTFMLSKPTKEIIHDYTLTLKSQIALSTSVFMKGSSGHTLDIKAREVMWKEGLDYKCGTGHGVGYILNVHEGPIGFRYYIRPGVNDTGIFYPGQIITVEPGVYKTGKYGIRLENELLVVEHRKTDQGIFYRFMTITYCPYDPRLIDPSMLNKEELEFLNSYNKEVYKKLSKQIKDKDELEFLKFCTARI